ncbi:MarR family transcriptional regulator [Blastomonas marina]|uniref:MarR family transcriptional regulator n=1 Tax=Blastomonas marina TaxID=1867408 RepID=UPI002AC9BA69|nr:MarR family transcriptional regulator [Blastomonas marina]WPZ04175.1 MarR family transcriptional regulator [Blastomonas marina]
MNQRNRRIKRLTQLLVSELQKDECMAASPRWVGGDVEDYSPTGRRRSAQWFNEQVKLINRAADLRDRFFGADIFRDPAWYILLDLFRYQVRGEDTSVSSACLAARAPPTTALRHLKLLSERGLVIREPDGNDERRTWVRLSDSAYSAMRTYFVRAVPLPDFDEAPRPMGIPVGERHPPPRLE